MDINNISERVLALEKKTLTQDTFIQTVVWRINQLVEEIQEAKKGMETSPLIEQEKVKQSVEIVEPKPTVEKPFNLDEVCEELKSRINICEFLLGRFNGKTIEKKDDKFIKIRIICPFENYSEDFYDLIVDDTTNSWKCMSCEKSGDIFDFITDFYKVDRYGTACRLADTYNIEIKGLKHLGKFYIPTYLNRSPAHLNDVEYYKTNFIGKVVGTRVIIDVFIKSLPVNSYGELRRIRRAYCKIRCECGIVNIIEIAQLSRNAKMCKSCAGKNRSQRLLKSKVNVIAVRK